MSDLGEEIAQMFQDLKTEEGRQKWVEKYKIADVSEKDMKNAILCMHFIEKNHNTAYNMKWQIEYWIETAQKFDYCRTKIIIINTLNYFLTLNQNKKKSLTITPIADSEDTLPFEDYEEEEEISE